MKKRPKSRRRHVAVSKALIGTELYVVTRRPIILSEEDIPAIMRALKAYGLRIVRDRRRA